MWLEALDGLCVALDGCAASLGHADGIRRVHAVRRHLWTRESTIAATAATTATAAAVGLVRRAHLGAHLGARVYRYDHVVHCLGHVLLAFWEEIGRRQRFRTFEIDRNQRQSEAIRAPHL